MNHETRRCSWCRFRGKSTATLAEHLRKGGANAQRWMREYRGLAWFVPPLFAPPMIRRQRQGRKE